MLTTKVDDKEPDHDHSSPTSITVVLPRVLKRASDTGNDEVGYGHADGTNDKHGLTAELVDIKNGGNRGEEHGNAYHACGQ